MKLLCVNERQYIYWTFLLKAPHCGNTRNGMLSFLMPSTRRTLPRGPLDRAYQRSNTSGPAE